MAPRQIPRWCSLSLPGIAVTWSPTLLCSRSLHSSRATLQDHHRDHRGGAVGALLILLRWVGDQLHSKGNVHLWHRQTASFGVFIPSTWNQRLQGQRYPMSLSMQLRTQRELWWCLSYRTSLPQRRGGLTSKSGPSLTPWLWKTGCGKRPPGPALCSESFRVWQAIILASLKTEPSKCWGFSLRHKESQNESVTWLRSMQKMHQKSACVAGLRGITRKYLL